MKNIRYYGADFCFHYGDVELDGGRIAAVRESPLPAPEDAELLLPGLIDIHTHGNSGADFCDGDGAGLATMARYLARCGVTSFAPASLTVAEETLAAAYRTAAEFRRSRPEGAAQLLGINMEGPFFSEKRKGAQNPAFLRLPDAAMVRRLDEACGGLIRIVDVAPELPGALPFIREISRTKTVSLGHTDCTYDEALAAFGAGASHLTHLFNCMPSIHHRAPGPICAGSETDGVRAELVCDGYHVHPAAVRLAFRMFGAARICLISDAVRACGMPEGTYTLGGQQIVMKDSLARLTDGTIAGAATDLFRCMTNAIRFGIPARDAVRAATWNPACAVGAEKETGSIAPGKAADLVLCGADWKIHQVYLQGKPVIS